jgi:serine/threonine-protein kinase SRPK3
MDTNIFYDDKIDSLYILVYKLGEGSFASVWFALELVKFTYYIKIRKSFEINLRALKVHMDDSYDEGMLETRINEIIAINGKKSNLINYPLSHFIYDDVHVVVVYELALGSLYDILKKFNRKLPIDFVEKIIPQMIESVKFVHRCGYIHTDVKPENYLLMGITKKQNDILSWTKKYNLVEKFRKLGNMKKIEKDEVVELVQENIYKFLKELSNKFEIKDNILNEESDDSDDSKSKSSNNSSDNSSSDNSDNSELDSIGELDDYQNYDSDYDTDCTSYNSNEGEYEETVDEFHIDEIIEYLNMKDNILEKSINKNENIDMSKLKADTELDDIKKCMENPIIKLMDFGLMEKQGSRNHTINTRYYRSPEIVLGLGYDFKTDIWSLGCSIYEMIVGKIMIDVEKNPLSDKYDKELVNIHMIIEKSGESNYKQIINLINKSPRKNKILNKNNTLKFINKIDYNDWIEDIDKEIGSSYKNYNSIIKTIGTMLRINSNERTY